jgi:hypothetical protein
MKAAYRLSRPGPLCALASSVHFTFMKQVQSSYKQDTIISLLYASKQDNFRLGAMQNQIVWTKNPGYD